MYINKKKAIKKERTLTGTTFDEVNKEQTLMRCSCILLLPQATWTRASKVTMPSYLQNSVGFEAKFGFRQPEISF